MSGLPSSLAALGNTILLINLRLYWSPCLGP